MLHSCGRYLFLATCEWSGTENGDMEAPPHCTCLSAKVSYSEPTNERHSSKVHPVLMSPVLWPCHINQFDSNQIELITPSEPTHPMALKLKLRPLIRPSGRYFVERVVRCRAQEVRYYISCWEAFLYIPVTYQWSAAQWSS